jgi:hypothetical protein
VIKARVFSRLMVGGLAVGLIGLILPIAQPLSAYAERYQSRLNSLLVKKTELYLPARLILGEEAKFVVRAQAGDQVKVFLSPKNQGFELADGVLLRVGETPEVLTGVVPQTGVLELKMPIPANEDLNGKVLYIDAAAGPTEQALAPLNLIDATGRKAVTNGLVITKRINTSGSPIMPYMPGVSPQLFNQLTTLGDIYTKKDEHRRELLDDGSINQNRGLDRNPFTNRGIQPGLR